MEFKNWLVTEMRHNTVGVMHYDQKRAVVWVDNDIAEYYRSLIPKAKYVQSQAQKAHITVIRATSNKQIEVPTNLEAWGKYEGEKVSFEYEPQIKFDAPYYYLDAWSDRIGDIREELGLPRFRHTDLGKAPFQSYHITLGNIKNR